MTVSPTLDSLSFRPLIFILSSIYFPAVTVPPTPAAVFNIFPVESDFLLGSEGWDNLFIPAVAAVPNAVVPIKDLLLSLAKFNAPFPTPLAISKAPFPIVAIENFLDWFCPKFPTNAVFWGL